MISILITTLHIFVALFLIVIVLLQSGKGSDVGAAFGGGSSQTLFGTGGAAPFLTKFTAGAAFIFMVTSISLTHLSSSSTESSILDELPLPAKTESLPATLPAAPAVAPTEPQSAPALPPSIPANSTPQPKADGSNPSQSPEGKSGTHK